MPSLFGAFQEGRANVIAALGEMLADPDLSKGLTNGQVFRLLSANLRDGTRGVDAARRNQHAEVIGAFGQVLNDAYGRGQLESEQRVQLLRKA